VAQPPASPFAAEGEKKPAAETPKAAPEAQKPAEAPKPPDYSKVALPKDSLLKPDAVEKVTAFAKEKGLAPEAAQAILEREHAQVQTYVKALDDQSKVWYAELEKDPVIGGPKLGESAELIKRGLEKYDTDGSVRAMIRESRQENNPKLWRFLHGMFKAGAEDTLRTGGRPAESKDKEKSPAQKMYPNNPSTEGSAT
jgi:hypothetical protein